MLFIAFRSCTCHFTAQVRIVDEVDSGPAGFSGSRLQPLLETVRLPTVRSRGSHRSTYHLSNTAGCCLSSTLDEVLDVLSLLDRTDCRLRSCGAQKGLPFREPNQITHDPSVSRPGDVQASEVLRGTLVNLDQSYCGPREVAIKRRDDEPRVLCGLKGKRCAATGLGSVWK